MIATAENVAAVLAFAREASSVLVHCRAGISRSSAMAFALLCQSLGPGREGEALAAILRIRPQALPNRLIVQLADGLLSRSGAMCEENERLRESRYMGRWSDDDLVAPIAPPSFA